MKVSGKIASFFCLLIFASACNFVNSQAVNSVKSTENSNAATKNSDESSAEIWETAKKGAEELNAEPLLKGSKPKPLKPLSREQIRESLTRNGLIGESKDGKIGGAKIAHFSHTCNLFVNEKSFYVVYVKTLLQLASSARGIQNVLIFDEKMKLVQNLKVTDSPLFCDGNRLIFNDYKMNIFYGTPEKNIRGNVLIFSNNANEIQAKSADLNFYRFRDLIY